MEGWTFTSKGARLLQATTARLIAEGASPIAEIRAETTGAQIRRAGLVAHRHEIDADELSRWETDGGMCYDVVAVLLSAPSHG